jgi:prophage antirepressor-like protein
MEIIKLFIDNNDKIEINIIGTIEKPLFQANQIGKLLDLKNINNIIKDYNEYEKEIRDSSTLGGKQKVNFLTEIGLYKVLFRSNKPIASEFQRWICNVIKEIRLNGKYELDKTLKETIDNHKLELELQRHELLLKSYDKIPGVYIGKLKEVKDDKIIIKIGNTIDINERAGRHKIDFNNFILLDFFEANRHISLETAIKKDKIILQYKYEEEINGKKSDETFLIPKDFYKDLITIITRKQKDYQGMSEEHYFKLAEKDKEIEKIKEESKLELLKLQKLQLEQNVPITIIKEVPIKTEIKEINQSRGRKIQKYTLDGKLVCTYNGLCIVTRNEDRLSESGIKIAINNNYEYKEHRWLYLDRNLPDDTFQEIGKTIEHKKVPLDFIAMLDIDNKYIIHVFEDQLTAAKSRHLTTTSGIYLSIKHNKLCKGHHFNYFNKCTEEQKNTYLENNKLPEIKRHFNAIKVKQINPITNEIIHIHNSYTDIQKKFQIGPKTIKKIIKNDEIYKCFKWSY